MCNREFIAIIVLIGTAFANNLKPKEPNLGKIVFASILFRHGDRTIIQPYPTDPYRNESLWTAPFGELTNAGKNQHLLLGRYFRQRYNDFLPEHYCPSDIYVRSTDVDRTLMSVQTNLAGMYPPKGNQIWCEFPWMPIPVHTVPKKLDNLLYMGKRCPRYDLEKQKVLECDELKKIHDQHKDLYQYLENHVGEKVTDVTGVFRIYDVLRVEALYNMKLPKWTKSIFPDKMISLAALYFELSSYNEVLQRLIAGPLLGQIMDNMIAKSKNTLKPDRKLWIYSAHDDNIVNMLKILGIYYKHVPPYTSSIMIELRVNAQNEYVVTVFYKVLEEVPKLMTIPGCTPACPLQKFISLLQHLIPEDWEKECSLNLEEPKTKYSIKSPTKPVKNLVSSFKKKKNSNETIKAR